MMRFDTLPSLTCVLAFLLVATAGCLNLSPRESQLQYYVLGADVAPDTRQASGAAEGLSIAFRPVRLASYLDTPALVTRLGPNRVEFAEFDRWGEGLRPAINRVVVGYIGAQMPVQRIDIVPLPSNARYDYIVQLRVLRFEGEVSPPRPMANAEAAAAGAVQTGAVRMVSNWEIIEPGSGRVLHHGTTDERVDDWTVGDHAGMVNRLDRALEILARDIIAALTALSPAG